MIKGTNPILVIDFSIEVSKITKLRITFAQGKDIVLEKSLADCTVEGNTIKLQLSEQETLSFKPTILKVQAKLKLQDGSILYSKIKEIEVEEPLNEETLNGEN